VTASGGGVLKCLVLERVVMLTESRFGGFCRLRRGRDPRLKKFGVLVRPMYGFNGYSAARGGGPLLRTEKALCDGASSAFSLLFVSRCRGGEVCRRAVFLTGSSKAVDVVILFHLGTLCKLPGQVGFLRVPRVCVRGLCFS
jgi:hypothetical protein